MPKKPGLVAVIGAGLFLCACGGSGTESGSDAAAADASADTTSSETTTDAGGCLRAEPVATCWTDPTTKLTWENPSTPPGCSWQDAVDDCTALSACGLTDWRLPTIDELRSLIRGCAGTVTGGACPVHVGSSASDFTSSCYCTKFSGPSPGGCFWDPVFGERCGFSSLLYWSSSETAVTNKTAWAASFFDARLLPPFKTDKQRVRCVRP